MQTLHGGMYMKLTQYVAPSVKTLMFHSLLPSFLLFLHFLFLLLGILILGFILVGKVWGKAFCIVGLHGRMCTCTLHVFNNN